MNQTEEDFNYLEDLHIDKYRLDEELILQPKKMIKYNTAHAQAVLDRDRAKQNLDVVKAELDSEIRDFFRSRDIKFTEAVVDGKIKTSEKYKEALNKFQEAEYNVNIKFSAVMAMNARRPILEDLVRLYLSGYWAEPRVGKEGAEMKASASQASTVDSIMRSQEIPNSSKPPTPVRPLPKPPKKA